MKTEGMPSGETLWNSDVDLLTDEGCLPVIGSCQVSSILQNLDDTDKNEASHPTTVDLIDIDNNVKTPSTNRLADYVILKENGINNKMKNDKKLKNSDNFEDMLYFVCNLCPFLCTKNSKITEHLENAHKNKIVRNLLRLKCPACTNIFFHKLSLRSHLIHDHGVGNSDLSQIIQAVVYYANNKTKDSEKNFTKVATARPSKNVIDSKTNEEFELNLEKTIDNLTNQDKEKIALPKVELNQNKTEKLFNTMMSEPAKYLDIKKFDRCTFPACKVQFQDVNTLSYHLSCHKDSSFECPVCKEMFSFWKPLASHLWRVHKIDMELYSCDKCDYKSISLYKLNNIHKLIHSDVKAFSCAICKKAFKNMKQLGNHKNTHKAQDKPSIVCTVCMKNFRDKRQLKIHMDVVHEKIKPFLCNYCGYKGSSRSSLKMHIRQHTGEKPFACDSCSYTTSDHNSLRRHKLRHSGQKPYKCSYCSYACIQSSTYKVHLKTKHPGLENELMFTCNECQFRSVNKEIYMAHMYTVHDQKPALG